jgi:hypothetical protein
MSRRGAKPRRKARKLRAPSQRFASKGHDFEWGEGPPLTPEQHSRVLQRFSNMRFRNFSVSFVPVFGPDVRFKAKTPEELEEAVRAMLLEKSKAQLEN